MDLDRAAAALLILLAGPGRPWDGEMKGRERHGGTAASDGTVAAGAPEVTAIGDADDSP